MSPAPTGTPDQNNARSRLSGSWAPIDTGFLRDRRIRLLSRPAKLLLLACQLRSNEAMSDGTLTKSDLRLAAAEADLDAKEEAAAVADLVRADLVKRHGIDYLIADFRGVSRLERERRQELARIRQQNKRERDAQRDGQRDIERDERDESVTVTRDPLPAEDRDRDFVKSSKEESSTPAAPARPDVEKVCSAFVTSLETRQVVKRTVTKDWRDAARLMIDKDRRTVDEILELIAWLTADSFWSTVVLSLPNLREKFDQVRLKRGRSNSSPSRRTVAANPSEYADWSTSRRAG